MERKCRPELPDPERTSIIFPSKILCQSATRCRAADSRLVAIRWHAPKIVSGLSFLRCVAPARRAGALKSGVCTRKLLSSTRPSVTDAFAGISRIPGRLPAQESAESMRITKADSLHQKKSAGRTYGIRGDFSPRGGEFVRRPIHRVFGNLRLGQWRRKAPVS